MLKLSLDLDPTTSNVVSERVVKIGDPVPVVVILENDGEGTTEFDTILMELYFNDIADVLYINPDVCPVAGELAGTVDEVVCAVSGNRITAGSRFDKAGPFSEGSKLALKTPREAPIGPFRGATGQAGLRSLSKPFSISFGEHPSGAAGKAATGIATAGLGETTILGIGTAFLGSTPVAVRSIPSRIRVIE